MTQLKRSSNDANLRRSIHVAAFIAVIGLFVSCASTASLNQRQDLVQNVRMGNVESSVDAYKKIDQPQNSEILWKYDLAMLEHFSGRYEDSISHMNDIHFKMENDISKNAGEAIGSFLLNENLADYRANIYEYLYLNAFNALNYYGVGDLEEAMVEVRRISNKQREYMGKYGEVVISENARLVSQLKDVSKDASSIGVDIDAITPKIPESPAADDIFRDSSFARYISMIFRMMYEDRDNARVDSQVLATLNPAIDVASELNIDDGKGRLDVLAFGGLISERKELAIRFPEDFIPFMPFISLKVDDIQLPAFRLKFVLPIFVGAANFVRSVRVTLSNGETKVLPLLEDFSDAVLKDVSAKAPVAFIRSVVRSISKKAAAVAAGAAALRKAQESQNSLSYSLAYIGVVTAVDSVDLSETADLRQCLFLPGTSYAGGFTLSPGTYSGTVEFLNVKGSVIRSEKFENIVVKNGKTVLVELSCLQ